MQTPSKLINNIITDQHFLAQNYLYSTSEFHYVYKRLFIFRMFMTEPDAVMRQMKMLD